MTSLRNLAFGGTALCALFSAQAALAQPPSSTEVDELLIVTRSLEQTVPLELSRQGHDLVLVDEETIRNKSYPDVSSALQMEVPGLYLAQQAGPFSYAYLSLQGGRAQDVLWTIDGIRINNRLYAGTLPTDTLPASMIERIEVLKGGEGLFYGTQAVAGAVNVVTKGFAERFGGSVTIGGDTNDSVHLDGVMRGASGPHRFVGFLSYDQSEGFEAFDQFQPSATLRDRGYEVFSGGLKYGIALSDNLSLSAMWIRTDADLDYPAPTRVAFSQNSREEDIVGVKLDYAPDEGLQFYVKAYHHDWDSRYTTVWNSLTAPVTQTVVDDNLYWGYKDQGVNALAKLPVGGIDWLAGYDFQQYEARDEVLIIDALAEDVHAVFAQVRTNNEMSERFNIGTGVRYNKGGENSATVWNVSGRFDLTDGLFVQGNIGSSFTLPTAENLFAVDPFSTFGNPFLEPEEGTNYNLSLGGRMGEAFEWMVTGFKRDVENLISFETDPALIPDVIEAHPDYSGEAYVNAGEAEFDGFEVLAAGRLGEAWRWNASYTANDAKIVGTTTRIQRIPESLWKAGLAFDGGDRWGATASALWVGDVFQNLAACAACTPAVPALRANYGDYYVVDLAAHWFIDADRKHKLVARLQNAFDEDYASRIQRSATDAPGGRFDPRYRGVPQTFHLRYTYAFGD